MHPADAAQAVSQNQTLYSGANAITNTFRAEASCYKCHGTIDGIAGGMRHISLAQLSDTRASAHLVENPLIPECSSGGPLTNQNCRMVHHATPILGTMQNCVAGDDLCQLNNNRIRLSRKAHPTGFHPVFYGTIPGTGPGFDWNYMIRPPEVEFTMRDMNGVWVDGGPKRLLAHEDIQANVPQLDDRTLQDPPLFDTSVEKLGRILARTDDFSACTASRYYSFFTGISIPVFDVTSPELPPMDAEAELLRDQLVALVNSMKQNQQAGKHVVRELFRTIWSSEAYRSRSLRVFSEDTEP
jgi:hypothetical protein